MYEKNNYLKKRQLRLFINSVLFISILFAFSGCSSSRIEYVGRKKRTEMMSHTIITAKELSYKTQQYLAINALADEYKKDPEKVIRQLAADIANPDRDIVLKSEGVRFTLFVLMELCVNQARFGNRENSLKYWMSACFYSYKYIFDDSITPPLNQYYTKLGLYSALYFYDIALSEITDYLIKKNDFWEKKPVFETVEGKVEFSGLKSDLLWSPKLFKKFINGLDYIPKNLLAHSFDSGIGVPLIGIRNEGSSFEDDKELTLLNQSYPFVFVLKFESMNFEKGIVKAKPEVYGAYKNEYIIINGIKVPLYKDYSVLVGRALESKQYITGLKYMFDPGKMGDLQELYFMAPYDPNKIPVVLVHGLMSEPRTWAEALNLLLSNRKIRENYQFIFYSYPTGQPAILSASQFREDLQKFVKKYDPDNNNPKMDYSVIVGHSMGGLLTSLVVQDSEGTYLADKFLGADISTVKLTESQRKLIESVFIFKALPFIKRVVLIGTPHRGAEMATYFYARIGSWLTSLPASLTHEAVGIMKGLKQSQKNKDIKALNIPSGIEDLAPDRGMKRYIINLPYGKNVVIYSIIGDKNEAGKVGGTDGVVAYESSHIDNVEREVIIKSGHDEIKKAACVKEIVRILLENLDDYNKNHKEYAQKIKAELEQK